MQQVRPKSLLKTATACQNCHPRISDHMTAAIHLEADQRHQILAVSLMVVSPGICVHENVIGMQAVIRMPETSKFRLQQCCHL
jgi:hypothetical protein